MSELDEGMVMVGEDKVSLTDLANFDMSDVEEMRISGFPSGHFRWRILGGEDRPALLPIDTKKGRKPGVKIKCECLEVMNLQPDPKVEVQPDPISLIGKTHIETFFIGDPEGKGLGFLKAFMADVGIEAVGRLDDLLLAMVDKEFTAPIKNKPNPDDEDMRRINFDLKKVKVAA